MDDTSIALLAFAFSVGASLLAILAMGMLLLMGGARGARRSGEDVRNMHSTGDASRRAAPVEETFDLYSAEQERRRAWDEHIMRVEASLASRYFGGGSLDEQDRTDRA